MICNKLMKPELELESEPELEEQEMGLGLELELVQEGDLGSGLACSLGSGILMISSS